MGEFVAVEQGEYFFVSIRIYGISEFSGWMVAVIMSLY
jgi:hypothetical protein